MDLMDQSLGQLARRIPGATRVFDAHRFDFCCAGNRTLRTAATAAGVDGDTAMIDLEHGQPTIPSAKAASMHCCTVKATGDSSYQSQRGGPRTMRDDEQEPAACGWNRPPVSPA